jgi:hypothetical protein
MGSETESKMRAEHSHPVLEWLESSGGSFNRDVFGLTEFEGMGVGAVALQDIPVSTAHLDIQGFTLT